MRGFLAIVLFFSLEAVASAQVTAGVLYRVVRIRIGPTLCSAFTIDVSGQQYLVTARHCLKGSSDTAPVEWWHDKTWKPIVGKVILPRNPTVDIAALTLHTSITVQYPLEPTSNGLLIGQQVYFAGYPFDLAFRGQIAAPPGFGELPFLKAGILSATDFRNVEAVVLYVDGQNNPGFSGGPIVFRPGAEPVFRVAGVVSAYRNEAVPVLKAKDLWNPEASAHDDLFARSNSGIVIGYAIEHIVQSIKGSSR